MEDFEKRLLELGRELSINQQKEADAVKEYTVQLSMIMQVIDELPPGYEEWREPLEKLAAATEE